VLDLRFLDNRNIKKRFLRQARQALLKLSIVLLNIS